MNLGRLGKQVFIAGAVIVFVSAVVFGSEWVMHHHYRSENEKMFHALGRELSGDNEDARERRKALLAFGKFTFGGGLVVMAVGGIFVFVAGRNLSPHSSSPN